MVRWVQAVAVVLLTISLGLHWAVLQTAAWAGMLVTYSQNASWETAVNKTFDGQHPCQLCRLVKAGRSAEKTPETQLKTSKIEACSPVTLVIQVTSPDVAALEPLDSPCPDGRFESPLSPPPRGA